MAEPDRKHISDPAGTREPGKDVPNPPVVDTPQGTQWNDPPPGAAPPNPRTPQIDRGDHPTRPARRRPVGVTLVAALILFNLIGAVMGLFSSLFAAPAAPIGAAWTLYFAAMSVVLGAVLYGFWTFKPWGWVGALTLSVLGAAFSLFQLVAFADVGIMAGTMVGLAVGLLVIWYLTRPAVRALFAHKSRI